MNTTVSFPAYRALSFALFIVAAAFLSAGCLEPTSEDTIVKFDRTYNVNPGTTVQVFNTVGAVEIYGWDHDYVRVLAVKSSPMGRIEIDKVKISVFQEENFTVSTQGSGDKVRIDYQIWLPGEVNLTDVRTSSGNIWVYNTTGDINTTALDGRIYLEGIRGVITANATGGNITVINGVISELMSDSGITASLSGWVNNATITSKGNAVISIPDKPVVLNITSSNITLGMLVIVESEEDGHMLAHRGDGGSWLNIAASAVEVYLE